MPNRIIKESIRTSKSVNALPDFLFRVWVYLITYVETQNSSPSDSAGWAAVLYCMIGLCRFLL